MEMVETQNTSIQVEQTGHKGHVEQRRNYSELRNGVTFIMFRACTFNKTCATGRTNKRQRTGRTNSIHRRGTTNKTRRTSRTYVELMQHIERVEVLKHFNSWS